MLKSKADFVREIEELVERDKVTYIDALLHYCANQGIEPEHAGSLIKGTPLKAKIEIDAKNLNFLER